MPKSILRVKKLLCIFTPVLNSLKMLKNAILFVASALVLASCSKPCVIGEGQPTLDSRKIDSFHTLIVDGPFDVAVVSDKERQKGGKASIEAQPNLLSIIKTEVKDSVLYVSIDGCVTTDRKMKIELVTGRIDKIVNKGSGDVNNEKGISTDNLEVINEGSGSMNLRLKSEAATLTNAGSGSMNISGFIAEAVVTLNGSGNFTAPRLRIDDGTITNDGSGSMEVWVEGTCQVFLNGSGSIIVNGKQESYQEKVTGSGSVTRNSLIIK